MICLYVLFSMRILWFVKTFPIARLTRDVILFSTNHLVVQLFEWRYYGSRVIFWANQRHHCREEYQGKRHGKSDDAEKESTELEEERYFGEEHEEGSPHRGDSSIQD